MEVFDPFPTLWMENKNGGVFIIVLDPKLDHLITKPNDGNFSIPLGAKTSVNALQASHLRDQRSRAAAMRRRRTFS